MGKRGQIKMSFGMIFSIILIIAFMGFAFFAIQKFLGLQSSINTKQLMDNLQNDVTNAWNSPQTEVTKSYNVPSPISKLCIETGTSLQDNIIFVDSKGQKSVGGKIEHLNLTAVASYGGVPLNSEVCFSSSGNKISLVIQKNFGDTLVTIKK